MGPGSTTTTLIDDCSSSSAQDRERFERRFGRGIRAPIGPRPGRDRIAHDDAAGSVGSLEEGFEGTHEALEGERAHGHDPRDLGGILVGEGSQTAEFGGGEHEPVETPEPREERGAEPVDRVAVQKVEANERRLTTRGSNPIVQLLESSLGAGQDHRPRTAPSRLESDRGTEATAPSHHEHDAPLEGLLAHRAASSSRTDIWAPVSP
jgi:hypothetical protein